MSGKSIPRSFFLVAAAFLFIVPLSLWYFTPVSADCGTGSGRSSCENCHQSPGASISQGAWHTSHAGKSACINCHGGNATTPDKAQAHIGVFGNPLTDVYTNCNACHPADYPDRAGSFARVLNVTPAGIATPARIQKLSAVKPENQIMVETEDVNRQSSIDIFPTILVASGGVVIALFFGLLVFVNLRQSAG